MDLNIVQPSLTFYITGTVGRIYTGIINNKVQGVRITRDQKDQLRQGVDVMMKEKLEPMVHYNQYEIDFHMLEDGLCVVGKLPNRYLIVVLFSSNMQEVPGSSSSPVLSHMTEDYYARVRNLRT